MCKKLPENYEKALEKWEKMTITSDPMFGMVMQNKEICLELINRALPHLKATQIVQLTTQKDINVVAGRRVRYDVYVQDEDGQHYVIEMQVADRQNLPYRLRILSRANRSWFTLAGQGLSRFKSSSDLCDHVL